jgi:hypothetical protein
MDWMQLAALLGKRYWKAEAVDMIAAAKVIKAKGVMMFSSTCHNEWEEMSRDGSSWLAARRSGVETEPFGPRGLGRSVMILP